jgi:hypothetical protein
LILKVVPIVGAVIAAILVLLAHAIVEDEWHWLDFVDDLVRNLLIGASVAVVSIFFEQAQREREERATKEMAKERQRRGVMQVVELSRLAASGWSPLRQNSIEQEGVEDLGTVIREMEKEITKLQRIADELDMMHQSRDEGFLAQAVQLPNTLAEYLAEGSRIRRFAYLQLLSDELGRIEASEDSDISAAISRFRNGFPAAVGWRLHTDATVIERLLVGKVVWDTAVPRPTSVERRELLDSVSLDSSAVDYDPVYLLQAYVTVQREGVTTLEEAERRIGPIRRCVGATRNELWAVVGVLQDLAELLQASMGMIATPLESQSVLGVAALDER